MASLNKVFLIGNLGRDPEIRTFSEGSKKATFTLATTERYKDKNGDWKDDTTWHNIGAFGFLADRAETYLKKGSQVFIEGRITTRTYTDSNNVEKKFTEIIASNFMILGKKESTTETRETPDQVPEIDYPPVGLEAAPEDDLPF
ncbi:MAG TPA: single-stranded DNA-binding protein [Bacteroidia bacterium]|nr:single-stranded DNA-binding protein [Sphingobacteriales bacterium]HPD64909.1 single-stranded DNA-binding protein [Bacteroidia bacterium]HRS58376.1 single-stranded DNA-binding protein [Bacteroidia bacterium]HRU67326.1 single-stranded DNA-binding protein [Bacteroidia bacterium]